MHEMGGGGEEDGPEGRVDKPPGPGPGIYRFQTKWIDFLISQNKVFILIFGLLLR